MTANNDNYEEQEQHEKYYAQDALDAKRYRAMRDKTIETFKSICETWKLSRSEVDSLIDRAWEL